jgi:peptidyl-prolyl cis-trans isomerase B (cyclophilin B)
MMARFSTRALALTVALMLSGPAAVQALPADDEVPFVRLQTDAGEILVALFPDLAPHHVGNFLHLASTGFYDGTVFHRVVPGFVIQGGDPNSKDRDPRNDGTGGPTLADVLTEAERDQLRSAGEILEARGYVGLDLETRASLKAEFSTTAKHLRGTLSMARSRDVDSAGSQFFICVDRTASLDRQYTVFGQVVTGQEVADAIVAAPTGTGRDRERPLEPVSITGCEVITGVSALTEDEQVAYRNMVETLAREGSSW